MANIRVVFVFVLSVIALITTPALSKTSSTPSCKSVTFSNPKLTFDNCIDLPTLNAVLHYTYDPTKSTLSMGFTAPSPNGWVAWALNPKDTGMVGAQALMAYKPKSSGPITVDTLDIVSYDTLTKGPISYNVTGLSGEETNGVITVCATWVIPAGETSVNQVWQVGPVAQGTPGQHEFNPENLESKAVLSLVSGPAGAPEMAPAGSPLGSSWPAAAPGSAPASAPVVPSKESGDAMKGGVVSMAVALGALLICFL